MKNKAVFVIGLISGVLAAASATLIASQVTGLVTFTSGTQAKASEVNGNFNLLSAAVNDIDTRITALAAKFGTNTSLAAPGNIGDPGCVLGKIVLTAGIISPNGTMPAAGQILSIGQNPAIFNLLGTTYGGNGVDTFALPDLRAAAPSGLTYSICVTGVFP